MPKVTEAHLEARKKQIIDAAAACFSQRGFHQTTMQDICKQAALSPGAVYRYFESKDDIIAAMVDERRREGVALVEAITARHENTLAALDEIARTFFSRLEDAQGCALDIELWAEAQANPRIREALRVDMADVNATLTEFLRRSQEHGEINPHLDAKAVSQVMESFFYGLILQRSIDPSIAVWPYVSVINSMMGGTFWQQQSQEGE